MTLKQRREQVLRDGVRSSPQAIPSEAPRELPPKRRSDRGSVAAEVKYGALSHRIELWNSDGKLVGYSFYNNKIPNNRLGGYVPKDGEDLTVKTNVAYWEPDAGSNQTDDGPQPVQVFVGWGCGILAGDVGSGRAQNYWLPAQTVVAPNFRHVPGWGDGTQEGTQVSFKFTFHASICADDVRKNPSREFPRPYSEGTAFGISSSDREWFSQGAGSDIWSMPLPTLPVNQTYGLGCGGNSASANNCGTSKGMGVNTATGALAQSSTDISLPGTFPLELNRSYSSNNPASGTLGGGWSASWDTRLEVEENGDAVLHAEDGSQYPFIKPAQLGGLKGSENEFEAPINSHSTLRQISSGYALATQQGEYLEFDQSGRLSKRRSAQGMEIKYSRDESGNLKKVTVPNGRSVEFAYVGDLLSVISTSDGRKVSYGYDSGRLSSVTGADDRKINYGYDADGRLNSVTDQRGNKLMRSVYDDAGKVVEQTASGAKGKITFSYRSDETDVTMPDGGIWTDVHVGNVLLSQYDPFGNKTSHQYTYRLDPVSTIDALGNKFTTVVDQQGRPIQEKGPLTSRKWDYGTGGDLGSYTDRNGKTSSYTHDVDRRLTEAKDPLKSTTNYAYNSGGQLDSIIDPRQKETKFEYDAEGNQTAVTFPDGSRQTREFDTAGRVTGLTDPRGNVDGAKPADFTTTYTYDDAGRILTESDAKGNTTTNTYDAAGNLETVTDNATRVTTYTYDAANRLTEAKDPADNITTTTYDDMGHVTSRTDAAGAKTTYTYDVAGRMATMTTPRGNIDGANAAAYTWKYGYDKVGNQTTVTDPTDKTTKTDYDAENRPVKVTDPLGHFTQTSYDGEGNVLTTTDELSKVTTNTYDDNGRLSSVEDRGSKPFSYGYDADGNLTSETTPLGFKTTYGYDDNGRLTDRVEPRGNVTGADPAQYTWHTGYDAAGNVTSEKDPLGNEATTTYDAVNNVTESADRRNKKTLYEYDTLYRLKKVTAPDGGTTLVDYDEAGLMSKRTDDNQHATTYEYDKAGRVTKITDPLKRATSYKYDPDGNREKVTNARGQTITTTYDGRNLPGTITYSDGTPKVTYTYYDDTRPKAITDGTGTRTVTYDRAGRPLSITQPGLTTPFKYTYNPNGTIASRTYPDGYATAYKYDDDGRLSTQTTSGKTTTYGWDEAGNLTSTKLPTTTALTENRNYDRAGQLASISEKTGTRQLSRDPDGRILTDTFKDATTTGLPDRYAYDEAGRMTRACTDTATSSPCTTGTSGSTYHYDKVGNLTSSSTSTTTRTNTHDAADQLTKRVEGTTTTDFTYDLDGNLTKDATGTYAYDAAGRTKSATIGADTLTFVYDADGNRTLVNKNGVLDRTTRWDINNPLAQVATETSSAGALIADYEYNVAGVAQAQNRTSGTFYMLHDRQDSVRAVHDATGKEVYTYTYTAWGVSTGTASTTGGQTSIFGYTGQYKDPYVSGRLNLRDRDYDPGNRRFTTTDPEPSTAGTPNSSPYAYANNDPANQSDPSGRCPLCVSAGIGAVIGAAVEGGIYSYQHRNDGQFSWSGFGKAAGEGAATGAVAGLLMPGAGNAVARGLGMSGWRGVAASAAVNAGVGAGFSWAVNETHCRPTDPWDLLIGAAGGGSSSLLGPAFTWLRGKISGGSSVARFGPGAAHADDPAVRPKPGAGAAGLPAQGEISPLAVRFSQDSIKGTFKNGQSVQDLVDALKAGRVVASDLPPIRVFRQNGKIYTLDNRRLYAFREAGVNIRFTRASAEEVQSESWKMTTRNDGTSIVVRGG
ncbi:DUF6531 domain-containing protein [Streptomyces sp. NPDC058409]|uniref:DUF6531 domain-containing protein n=1 Tax=Streptomyces sp. NPDC058409 TaxID=3346484 RepID=UPI003666B4ED